MQQLLKPITTAAIAFAATNIDDIFVLMLFFAQVGKKGLRPWHIIVGQYLGFSVLVAASVIGFLTSLIVPRAWIGLLGLVPIAIGVKRLLDWKRRVHQQHPSPENTKAGPVFSVAAVTFANGGDNIGIYTPLFAASDGFQLATMIAIFFVLIAGWCVVGYFLGSHPAISKIIDRYGHGIVPFVLMGLGIYIIVESDSLKLLGL